MTTSLSTQSCVATHARTTPIQRIFNKTVIEFCCALFSSSARACCVWRRGCCSISGTSSLQLPLCCTHLSLTPGAPAVFPQRQHDDRCHRDSLLRPLRLREDTHDGAGARKGGRGTAPLPKFAAMRVSGRTRPKFRRNFLSCAYIDSSQSAPPWSRVMLKGMGVGRLGADIGDKGGGGLVSRVGTTSPRVVPRGCQVADW